MQKSCRQCGLKYEVTDEDLKFYDKISPILAGKKYTVPPPNLCPDCRQQRRLAFRNERKLYNDQCDLCKKPIISLYSPDKHFQVYCQECWWSDKWDPLAYGQDFDFNHSFSEQFKKLQISVPRVSIFNLNSANSEYTNHSANNKNCYMGVALGGCEDCMYSHWLLNSKDCLDMLYCEYCEQCCECSYCQNCHTAFFSQHCQNTRDSIMCFECKNCEYCIGCIQLQHKKFHVLNKQVSKEEFEKTRNEILASSEKFQEMAARFTRLKLTAPHRHSLQLNCYNCVGDDLYNCKNSYFCFNGRNVEDSKYMYDLGNNKDSMDCYEHGWLVPSELNYEVHAGMAGYHLLFCNICSDSQELMYSDLCFNNSKNNFGCVGLKKKNYCVFNKQYTKEEYEKFAPKVIEHMRKTGEWGEFFAPMLSPFGYNETSGPEYFQLEKQEALKKGFNWSDYNSPQPKTKKVIKAKELPSNIRGVTDEILDMAIECEISKKPFNISKYELKFYRMHNLPIPQKHPDQRHYDRMKLRNPRKLWSRKCANCKSDIQTTYSPDRPEKVYCEKCYLNEIY